MKFVVRINPETLKQESFAYLEPGPIPSIADPENPEEAKDGRVLGPDEISARKKKHRRNRADHEQHLLLRRQPGHSSSLDVIRRQTWLTSFQTWPEG